MGQQIEVRPGIVSRTQDGHIQCKPIRSCIVSLFTESNELQYAVPGGLIGGSVCVSVCLCAFVHVHVHVCVHVVDCGGTCM